MTRPDHPTQSGMDGVYGRRLGECFGFAQVPAFVRIEKTAIAVTRIHCDWPNNGLTAPLPVDDAFLLTLHLQDCAHHDLWIDGRPRRTGPLRSGDVSIYDLRTSPVVNSTSPFRNMHFYLPRATLNAVAELDGIPSVDELPNEPGIGRADAVIASLGRSLEGAFDRPNEVSRILVDHVTMAVAARLARAFGTHSIARESRVRKLSMEQRRIVLDMLGANLKGDISTLDLAEACGMAPEEFRYAFQDLTGSTPHQWIVLRRVERALDLLRNSRRRLVEIAQISGFVDVRHLRRVLMVSHRVRPEDVRSR